jgi:hypothetical protein
VNSENVGSRTPDDGRRFMTDAELAEIQRSLKELTE